MPWIIGAIALMGVFFFASSFYQLGQLGNAMQYRSDPGFAAAIAGLDDRASRLPAADAAELGKWKTLAMLEQDAVRQRYTQVNTTLLVSAWTRNMGFVTGVIMALTGAIFVLAKLSEPPTTLSGETTGAKAALSTQSPGLVLATLGTVLMVVTLNIKASADTRDAPIYLRTAPAAAATSFGLPHPQELPEGPAVAVPSPLTEKGATNATPAVSLLPPPR